MSNRKGAFLGLLATLVAGPVLAGLFFLVGFANEKVSLALVALTGLVQLIYVIPMYRYAKRNGIEGMKIGLVIGASIVFLFWATCGGLLLSLTNSNFR